MKTSSSSSASAGPVDAVATENPSPAFSELSPVDAEIRRRMIADAAYYRAEARGFANGYELEDWLEAEAEVDLSLLPSALGPLQV